VTGYDELNVQEIQKLLAEGDDKLSARVRDYERPRKRRDGVLHTADAQLSKSKHSRAPLTGARSPTCSPPCSRADAPERADECRLESTRKYDREEDQAPTRSRRRHETTASPGEGEVARLDHAGRRRRDGGPETDFPYTTERELDERPSTVSWLLSCESQAEAHQHHPADRDRRAEAGQGLEQGTEAERDDDHLDAPWIQRERLRHNRFADRS
jgi:hypothetical protein